jgi:hypothetical protein
METIAWMTSSVSLASLITYHLYVTQKLIKPKNDSILDQ